MNPTKQQIRQLRRDNAQWPPALKPIPPDQWPADTIRAAKRIEVWRCRDFLVQVFQETTGARLSVCRTDWDQNARSWRADISWDDLQRLKAETGRGSQWAVEVFPPDWETVNVANMRHIWCLDEAPAFGWRRERGWRA